MKKRMLVLSLAIACTLSMAACGPMGVVKKQPEAGIASETNTEESSEAETTEESSAESAEAVETSEPETSEEASDTTESSVKKTAAEVPSELSDDIYSFQVSIDGTVYQFPMWFSDFEALGWTYTEDNTEDELSSNQYTFSCTWEKDGFKVSTQFANLSMNSVAIRDSMVASITLDNYDLKDCPWEILLPGGIQYGVSSRDDIVAAYGDPSDEYEGDLYYNLTYKYDSYQDIDLYVYKESGVLEKIELRNIVELEGADNSVSTEVPEIVKGYTAPDELGDDLYQFNIELEGNLYTLPCPVSELLANGFTLGKDSAEAIAAGNSSWITLNFNNQSYDAIVENYADYATIPENCFLTTMKCGIHGPEYEMTIPCNIKCGDSEDSLKATLENFNYEVETSGDFTYYTVFAPDTHDWNSFTIITKEGAVAIIEVENSEEPEY